MMNDRVALYCVNPSCIHDIHSIFVSNHLVFRHKLSQCVTIITVLMPSGCFETPQTFEGPPRMFELCQALINNRSPWLPTYFLADKIYR